jgi:FG-GAP repeat
MWRQQAKLVGTSTTFLFGYSVSLSGDGKTAIVGAPFENGEVGAAWVFTRSHWIWTQQTKLVGTGVTGAFAGQGTSVAISGDGNTAVVGGLNDNDEVGAALGVHALALRVDGPSRRNWSAGTPSATQSKGLPSQFRATAILSSWVGQMTTVGRARYGYSENNQCSPECQKHKLSWAECLRVGSAVRWAGCCGCGGGFRQCRRTAKCY